MQISLVGVNHHTAPIEVRERVAIRSERLGQHLSLLRNHVAHGVILSTCNRTEIYAIENNGRQGEQASLKFFQDYLDIPDTELVRHAYVLTRPRAVAEHLFRLACGLDSLIIGEYEVLGQVGGALEMSEKAGMVNLPLRHLFQSAIRTGRRIREETGISKNALSVSSVAVDLATRAVGDLSRCRILVIGAGEAGRLVAKAARDRGTPQILVASRTRERASALASMLGGIPIDMSNVMAELNTCNIVIACADAPHWILSAQQISATMGQRPDPLVIIDIAVPRNVDPAAGQIDNVFLYNIDDLTEISEANRKQREDEIAHATEIIGAELDKLGEWLQALEIRPAVRALMEKAELIRSAQLEKTLKKIPSLSQEERDYVDAMTRSIIVKILKDPLDYLKSSPSGNGDAVEVISQLFRLETDKTE